jgi:Glutaminase
MTDRQPAEVEHGPRSSPDDRSGTERVSTGVLSPDTDVQALITAGYKRYLDLDEGAVADYIPALAAASPSAFGVCVAGVQGRLFSIGDPTRSSPSRASRSSLSSPWFVTPLGMRRRVRNWASTAPAYPSTR